MFINYLSFPPQQLERGSDRPHFSGGPQKGPKMPKNPQKRPKSPKSPKTHCFIRFWRNRKKWQN